MEYEKLTVKQVAEELQVNPKTVYEWFKRGLPKLKIGRMTRIRRGDLEEFFNEEKA